MVCALPGYLVTRKFITTDATEPIWEVELAKIKTLNDKRFADRWMGGTLFEIAGLEWDAEAQMTRESEVNLYDLVDFLKLNPEVFFGNSHTKTPRLGTCLTNRPTACPSCAPLS